MAVWAACFLRTAAHIAFHAQRVKLAPAMKKLRQGLVPAALIALGIAPLSQANCLPSPVTSGTGAIERVELAAVRRDGISLDEAVRRAEAQYHAKVVRTDVQDEDGRTVYVLKLLSEDGRVITVRIDAATGRMR
jgi:Peptidase propeptide and YPEB domain